MVVPRPGRSDPDNGLDGAFPQAESGDRADRERGALRERAEAAGTPIANRRTVTSRPASRVLTSRPGALIPAAGRGCG